MLKAIIAITVLLSAPGPADTVTVITSPAIVSASRQPISLEKIASPSTTVSLHELESMTIGTPEGLSGIVPSLHIPDYGSSMTSTIYLRGLGSRMENPVMGLYVDDIPILDKNAYDIRMPDLAGATLIRGPQGTLFGRNSMCGVLSLHTISPSEFKGTRASASWGSANSISASVGLYSGNDALSVGVNHTDGFYDNVLTGKKVDPGNGASIRWRHDFPETAGWSLGNSLSASFTDEGGYPYRRYHDGTLDPVSYDDKGGYTRIALIDGLSAKRTGDIFTTHLIGSVQLLYDRMRMDQDFTPKSIFNLKQSQRSAATTVEATFRPAAKKDHWNSTTGVFGMLKFNSMKAPVTFFREGIESLMLENANKNIPASIGHLDIPMDRMPIYSDFGIWTGDLALYHESVFTLGRWDLTAGLRLDLEGGHMSYDSRADIVYRFYPTMASPKDLSCSYRGGIGQIGFELLPKISALYNAPSHDLRLYFTVSKGHKAGGFNTQIFSDILQNVMMNSLMDDLGVHFDEPFQSVGAGNTKYKPEEAWNFESGIRMTPSEGLHFEASLYNILCRNQQITVFPPGKSTGRMMANAGRTRSTGAELEASYHKEGFTGRISYSWNDARFTVYNDGNEDYSGKHVPYSPAQTLFAMAEYRFTLKGKSLRSISIGGDLNGTGTIYWNESNTLKEPFHLIAGATLRLAFDKVEVFLRGENLTQEKYNTFYFKSVGNEFFQIGKPARIMAGLSLVLPK